MAVAVALFFLGCGDAAVEATYPIERARMGFVRRAWSRVVGMLHSAEASAENVRLRREVAAAAMALGDMARLESENIRLRKSLAYAERQKSDWQPAAVLSEGGGAAARADTIRVAAGTLQGVHEGAVAAVPDGLVGIVSRVTPHTAEIVTIASANVLVGCEVDCGRPMACRGILSGGSREQLAVRHMRSADGVAVRSRVVTSGCGGVFPAGIEIGTVIGLVRGPDGDVVGVDVAPSVDFDALEDVFIRRER